MNEKLGKCELCNSNNAIKTEMEWRCASCILDDIILSAGYSLPIEIPIEFLDDLKNILFISKRKLGKANP